MQSEAFMKMMIPPENFPDPWLYDSTALLADLDSIRELILRIPLTKESFAPTNVAVGAVWELRDRLRFLIGLQAERQREWAKEHAATPPKTKRVRSVPSRAAASA